MGYLCPVCEEPFGDDQQCANHLAVTAILHGRSHETWLAEVVDDWETIPRSELAEVVAETADPTSDDHDHPSDHTHPVGQDTDGQPSHGQSAPLTGCPDSRVANQRSPSHPQQPLSWIPKPKQSSWRPAS